MCDEIDVMQDVSRSIATFVGFGDITASVITTASSTHFFAGARAALTIETLLCRAIAAGRTITTSAVAAGGATYFLTGARTAATIETLLGSIVAAGRTITTRAVTAIAAALCFSCRAFAGIGCFIADLISGAAGSSARFSIGATSASNTCRT